MLAQPATMGMVTLPLQLPAAIAAPNACSARSSQPTLSPTLREGGDLFSLIDHNNDGVITRQEWQEAFLGLNTARADLATPPQEPVQCATFTMPTPPPPQQPPPTCEAAAVERGRGERGSMALQTTAVEGTSFAATADRGAACTNLHDNLATCVGMMSRVAVKVKF
eukprot:1884854-Amphidinium_carterae.1